MTRLFTYLTCAGAIATTGIPAFAAAETIDCILGDKSALTFNIDRTQFAPPIDKRDPPRRQVTNVTHGTVTYTAEPFVIGSTRGFHAQPDDGMTIMFSVDGAGKATYSHVQAGRTLSGTCEDK